MAGTLAKPRIAWFSPLAVDGMDSSTSVSAYCTDVLVDKLAQHYDLELFHDGEGSYRDYQVHSYGEAVERHKQDPFNLFFYQLENSPASRFCRLHMEMVPGAVWFHDIYFTDPLPIVPGAVDRARMQTGILHTTDDLLRLDIDADDPLGVREFSHAALKIFSSERNADVYGQLRKQLESRTELSRSISRESYVPYPVALDSSWSSSPSSSVVVFCGTTRSEHRAHKLCSALAGMNMPVSLVWCIDPGEKEAAERILSKAGLSSYELVENRSVEAWIDVLKRAAVAVHTVFSAYSDPGPWLAASLMAGVPSLVTNFGYGEYLPDKIVTKIDPGEGEVQALANAIGGFLKTGSAAADRSIGAAAKSFAEEHHAADVVAEELHYLLAKHSDYLQAIREKWERYVIHKSSIHPSQKFTSFGFPQEVKP